MCANHKMPFFFVLWNYIYIHIHICMYVKDWRYIPNLKVSLTYKEWHVRTNHVSFTNTMYPPMSPCTHIPIYPCTCAPNHVSMYRVPTHVPPKSSECCNSWDAFKDDPYYLRHYFCEIDLGMGWSARSTQNTGIAGMGGGSDHCLDFCGQIRN